MSRLDAVFLQQSSLFHQKMAAGRCDNKDIGNKQQRIGGDCRRHDAIEEMSADAQVMGMRIVVRLISCGSLARL